MKIIKYFIIFVVGFIFQGCFFATSLLFRYDNAWCERKVITPNREMILVENKGYSAIDKNFYHISRNSLNEYLHYLNFTDIRLSNGKLDTSGVCTIKRKEIKLYDKNSSFVIKKYYEKHNQVPFGYNSYYFLVQTPDNLQAWLSRRYIDTSTCSFKNIDIKFIEPIETNYHKKFKKVFINYKIPPKAFDDNDELFSVSKKYARKFLKHKKKIFLDDN